jgi:hypothetical protein
MHRNIGGLRFGYVAILEPARTRSGALRLFRPQSRYDNRGNHSLHTHGRGAFCRFAISWTDQPAGVYALTLMRRVMYIGECADLASRFNNGYGHIAPRACFDGGQTTNCKINRQVLDAARRMRRIRLWFYPTSKYKTVERHLLATIDPPWNGRTRA